LHIREILVPVDFSDHAKAALAHALLFASQFGAAVTLLNVIEPPVAYPESIGYTTNPDHVIQALEKCIAEVSKRENLRLPLIRRAEVVAGDPCEKILETASLKKVDLIIISTHGRTGLAHALLGSTAEKIIRQAPCPVLVIRYQQPNLKNAN
jgi:nucleotide-binding universal stress UspA family protein